MRFLSNLVASTIGALIAIGIIVFFGFTFLIALSLSSDTAPRVRANSVLKMNMSGGIAEQSVQDPLRVAFGGSAGLSLLDILDSIETAKSDDRIEGIWLKPQGVAASWPQLEEIRSALIDFKTSGKAFYASSGINGFSEKDYYLASVADSVFSPKESYFELNGFYLASEFYKNALEKIDVTPEIIRSGKFKSAVEPYIRTDLSPENEEQLSAIVNNTDALFMKAISESRNISISNLDQLSDQKGIYTSQDAFDANLLDGLWYERQVEDLFSNRIEWDGDPRWTSLSSYVQGLTGHSSISDGGEDQVAIVYATGTIDVGKSGDSANPLSGGNILGSSTFNSTLERLADDEDVKAIVLRIDSPGGSSAASDVMWDAVKQAQLKKPIVVSMGSLAASGGYYIAAPADYIVASPSTITGSIGVFAMFLNPVELFENKLGVNFDVVKTGPYADMFGLTRKLSDRDKEIIGRSVDQTYDTFINKVAEGRNMTPERVNEIAQGRVWTGVDALRIGLVDSLGTLSDAVDVAASKAGLDSKNYSVILRPTPRPLMEQLSDAFSVKVKSVFTGKQSKQEKALIEYKEAMTNILSQNGKVQTLLPFRFVIE